MKIEELKQIVESASNLPPKRLKIIYSNTEYRLKDIIGLEAQHVTDLEDLTSECIDLIDNNQAKESYDTYLLKLNLLLDNILATSALGKGDLSKNLFTKVN